MARITINANVLTGPSWAGDFFNREHLVPGGAKLIAAEFLATDAVVVTTTAEALATATTIAVAALSGAIPVGTILYFGAASEFARLTAAAAAGATSLTVEALPQTIESGDVATYTGSGSQLATVVSGTPVGRTFAERAAGTGFGVAAAADDEVYLVAFDVTNVANNNDVELYRYGGIVKENLLPNFATLIAGVLTKIRANYQTTRGTT